jgi:Uncharacterized protein conserved in bacteria (DUF2330)
MRLSTLSVLGFSTLAALGVFTLESEAKACGGCFVPTENNTVVTDHRMVLAVSQQQTTLYDQIRYQGSPASFAWVLPIRGTVDVGISSDAVFATLDAQTSVQVIQPPANCPPAPPCNRSFGASENASAPTADSGSVTVLKEETVGPYETVQLRSTDPQALTKWLVARGYVVTPEIAPVINAYVAESFDFLALKLVPGTSVRSMRPVRVSAAGAGPGLPLRMVAAGTGAKVGISLWVVGDGRWEAQNFPSFQVKAEELIWDWKANSSNFKSLRAQKNSDLGGSAWENESSVNLSASNLEQQIQFGSRANGVDAAEDYADERDANGKLIKSGKQLFNEDMGALFGNNRGQVRVTRMRADLPQASLAADLNLKAADDQGELSRSRQVTKEAGEPTCPVYSGCDVVGQAPRSQAYLTSGGGGLKCSTTGTSQSTSSTTSIMGLLGALGLTFLAARRMKKSRN